MKSLKNYEDQNEIDIFMSKESLNDCTLNDISTYNTITLKSLK